VSRPSFFAELQRRHVYKVGAMYCVGGWLLVQVATQVFPFFDISNAAVRWVVLAVVAGLPVTLILSWLFDITPQGIVRTPDAPAAETPAVTVRRRGMERRLNVVLGLLLLAALAYFGFERLHPNRAAPEAADKSIAVLPFDNLSDDKANAYFAEGIQDQVLTQLAKIGALRVISRTSTGQYAARPPSVAEIAKQLGVANILEGSVQKAGDAVRINVQLIRADGDQHLWAETYDRKLDNIFGVESEVAEAIAQALDARLSGAEKQQLATRATRNPAAWDGYLRALVLYNMHAESAAAAGEAERLLREALRLDPDFATAWALLAEIKAADNIENWDTSDAGRAEALHAVQQAQRLQPSAAETHAAQGYYQFYIERDYASAGRSFELALQQAPGNADIISALAFLSRRQGRWPRSLDYFDQALALDPRNVEYLDQAATTAAGTGKFDLAWRYYQRCRDVAPGEPSTRGLAGWLHQAQGRLDLAESALNGVDPDPTDLRTILVLGSQQLFQRRYGEGAALLQKYLRQLQPEQHRERAFLGFQLGEFQRLSGQADAARASYLQAGNEAAAVLAAQPRNAALLDRQALIHARLGDMAVAMDESRRAMQTVPAGGDALSLAAAQYTRARLQAAAGDRDGAFETLQALLAGPTLSDSEFDPLLSPATLRLNPEWEALRQDPRFAKLLGSNAQ
jgi:TolB-like protein/Tfp pilus assembly protein PilF